MRFFAPHICVGIFYFCDLENELQIVYIGFLKAFLYACVGREMPKNYKFRHGSKNNNNGVVMNSCNCKTLSVRS